MRFLSFFVRTALVTVALLACVDALVRLTFPHMLRFGTNFSAAYLRREIEAPHVAGRVLFLGDSAFWGYKLAARDAAVSQLVESGAHAENLSFEGGSIVNTYAMLRAIEASGGRPALIVFNVNLKEFNAADSAYATLYPSLEKVAWPLLRDDERKRLKQTQKRSTFDALADDGLSRVWALYGLRSDIRNALFTEADAATAARSAMNHFSGEEERAAAAHRPTPDRFLGTYDLSPLENTNVEVFFLRRLAQLTQLEHVRAVAILTPTNHTLLHEYIDSPDYTEQLRYVTALLESLGVRVLNYDRRFVAGDFIDNDHLTAKAQRSLAAQLRKDIKL